MTHERKTTEADRALFRKMLPTGAVRSGCVEKIGLAILADLSSAESEIQRLKADDAATRRALGCHAESDDDTGCGCLMSRTDELAGEMLADVKRLRAEIAQLSKRPDGWEYTHEHQGKLVQRDGMMCEQHPGLPFEHDPACPGPGMPWMVEGRTAIEALRAEADALRAAYKWALNTAISDRGVCKQHSDGERTATSTPREEQP